MLMHDYLDTCKIKWEKLTMSPINYMHTKKGSSSIGILVGAKLIGTYISLHLECSFLVAQEQ